MSFLLLSQALYISAFSSRFLFLPPLVVYLYGLSINTAIKT
ncbi:hypothetical protein B4125_1485 [Bacillus paralicheniformis]|nr:hypothetical protein SC10_B2orf02933 [Bacillus paralicheniformis]OLG07304.1 hypothetical protein B4125_1485 [Bacillus paralicheniformis]